MSFHCFLLLIIISIAKITFFLISHKKTDVFSSFPPSSHTRGAHFMRTIGQNRCFLKGVGVIVRNKHPEPQETIQKS